MYEDYAELQFVERNANENDRRRHAQRVQHNNGNRTFGTMVPQHNGNPFFQHNGNPFHQQYSYPQPGMGIGMGGSSLFGGMTTGQVVGMVAEIFAALMPLPQAPVATADVPTDVGNLMLYQGSLAQYAKRDEQVRTLGSLVTKLVG